jgi:hypothetical protein
MRRTCQVILFCVIVILSSSGCEATKRHSRRHRRVPGPDPVVLGSANGFEAKEAQQENQHKPNFERCDDYKPEVLEEAPTGKTPNFIGMLRPALIHYPISHVSYRFFNITGYVLFITFQY